MVDIFNHIQASDHQNALMSYNDNDALDPDDAVASIPINTPGIGYQFVVFHQSLPAKNNTSFSYVYIPPDTVSGYTGFSVHMPTKPVVQSILILSWLFVLKTRS